MRKYIYIIFICFFACNITKAQNGVSAESNYFVHNNTSGNGISIHGKYVLKSVAKTDRSDDSSAIVFDKNSSWSQITPNGYIDGKVLSKIDSNFVFPVGNNDRYCPLGLTNSKNSTVIYYNEYPFESKNIDTRVLEALYAGGYWYINSKNTSKISLCIAKSDVANERLTIVGLKDGDWSVIPSKVDDFPFDFSKSELSFSNVLNSPEIGSISTTESVDLTNYQALAVGVLVNESIISKSVGNSLLYRHLRSIYFPFNEKNLTEYSTNLLSKLVRNIPVNAKIKLVGNTDFYGTSEFNYSFGMERANTIKTFLKRNGIKNIEIEIQSEGEDNPKVDCKNCSSNVMVLNRRVDIFIVK